MLPQVSRKEQPPAQPTPPPETGKGPLHQEFQLSQILGCLNLPHSRLPSGGKHRPDSGKGSDASPAINSLEFTLALYITRLFTAF